MPRLELEQFAGRELARVYIAGRVSEAEAVESVLTRNDIDYTVDLEPYLAPGLGLFTSEYPGVAFYVPAGQAAVVRTLLVSQGLKQGIADEED
jgi:hypothetical protein